MSTLRLGIDVGGTNTDAAVIDENAEVIAWTKTATTPDPLDGIVKAMEAVLTEVRQFDEDASSVTKAMLGTTHPANAIIQRKDLDKVGVLRLAAPSALGIRPGADWPADLHAAVIGPAAVIEGGFEYDGQEISPLDEEAVRAFAEECLTAGVKAAAVSCAFSPANYEHELRAEEIITEVAGEALAVSLSHQVGTLSLLERENATALNASLLGVARRVVDGFQAALKQNGLAVEAFLTQNDGTLMTAELATAIPVLTVGSGPTNSMRGACALAGLSDALVIDVGGTSADVGILVGGFPRESAFVVEVGGVRTNFRMPDLVSIGLGGGTIVRQDNGNVTVGPDSVGYKVSTEAIVAGGSTLTLSDVGVAAGRLHGFGEPGLVSDLDSSVSERAVAWVDGTVEELCDRMKASRQDMPLIAVGGGSPLVSDTVPGITEVIRPPHHGVANAYGAAIAEASGAVDRVFRYESEGREESIEAAQDQATAAAVEAGADPQNVRITAVTEIPMSYVPGGGCRVQVKAVGPLTG